jgi:hypothetical protein
VGFRVRGSAFGDSEPHGFCLTVFDWINEAETMSQLTVIAKLKAKRGAEEKLFEECRKLIAPTLAEEDV